MWKIKAFFKACCTEIPHSSGKELKLQQLKQKHKGGLEELKENLTFGRNLKAGGPLINKIIGFE